MKILLKLIVNLDLYKKKISEISRVLSSPQEFFLDDRLDSANNKYVHSYFSFAWKMHRTE